MNRASKIGRRGFTLVELLIVMVMLGILAGLALPSLQSAVWKARSAEVVSDIHTITVAYHEFLADGGGRINNAAWGRVPPALLPYLPDGFSFTDPFVDYRWTRVAPNASPWESGDGNGPGQTRGEVREGPNAEAGLDGPHRDLGGDLQPGSLLHRAVRGVVIVGDR